MTCNVLVKPLIHLFAGEFESGKWRQKLTLLAADKTNECMVEKVILESLEYFKLLNPEALLCKRGQKIVRPAW